MQKIKVQGVQSDLIQFKSTGAASARNVHIFFVAGNPGTVFFYYYFLQQLHAHCEAKFPSAAITLHALGHANHHLKDHNDINEAAKHENFGLDYQIQHHMHYVNDCLVENTALRDAVDSPPPVELVFIGHSIGCYMVLEMLKRSRKLFSRTVCACLLMPFMLWRNIPLSHRLKLSFFLRTQAISSALTVWLLGRVLRLSPPTRRSMIEMGTKGNLSPEQLGVISDQLVTDRLVRNFLAMGMDEIVAVPRDEEEVMRFLREELLGRRQQHYTGKSLEGERGKKRCDVGAGSESRVGGVYFLYTDRDEWAPQEDMAWLEADLGLRCVDTLGGGGGGSRIPAAVTSNTPSSVAGITKSATPPPPPSSPSSLPRSYMEFIPHLTHGFSMADATSDKVCASLLRFLEGHLGEGCGLSAVDKIHSASRPEPVVPSSAALLNARSRL